MIFAYIEDGKIKIRKQERRRKKGKN